MEWIDLGLLVGGLALAVWPVHFHRSHRGLGWLAAAALAWFGFVRQGCVCSMGAIQNVTLALCNPAYKAPLTVMLFFLVPLVFALFFGRVFCSGVCPMGALQELLLIRPIRLPTGVSQVLSLFPWVFLAAIVFFVATGAGFLICRWDPFVSLFRFDGPARLLRFGGWILAASLVIGRPFCRVFCPYGALLGLLARFSQKTVSVTSGKCSNCRICESACPYAAIPPAIPAPTGSIPGQRILRFAGFMAVPVLVLVGAWVGGQMGVALSDGGGALLGATRHNVIEFYTNNTTAGLAPAIAGRWTGGLLGLAFAVILVSHWRTSRSTVLEPDPSACLACARCYDSCPKNSEVGSIGRTLRNFLSTHFAWRPPHWRLCAGIGALLASVIAFGVAREIIRSADSLRSLDVAVFGAFPEARNPAGGGAQLDTLVGHRLEWRRNAPWLLAGAVASALVLTGTAVGPDRLRPGRRCLSTAWLAHPVNRGRVALTVAIAGLLLAGHWWAATYHHHSAEIPAPEQDTITDSSSQPM